MIKYFTLWYWTWRYSLKATKWREFLRKNALRLFKWYRSYTFDLYAEYGFCLPVVTYEDKDKTEWAKEFLRKHMDLFIPPEFQHRVEYRAKKPMDFGRLRGIAWYYRLGNTGKTRSKGYKESEGYWVI